jgi:hypothetical protein
MLTSMLMPGVLLVVGQTADPQNFYQDFRNALPLQSELTFTGPNIATNAAPGLEGLHLTLPAGRTNTAPVGLQGKFEIVGDCEMTGGYELLAADAPTNKYSFVGVNLYAAQYGGKGHVKFGRYDTLERGQLYMAQITDRDKPREQQTQTKLFPTKAQAGELRIARKGSTVSFSVKDSTTGGAFKELLQADFNSNPLGPIRFVLTTNDEPVGAEARLIDLHVQSKAPRGPLGASAPSVTAPLVRRGVGRGMYVAVVVLMAVAAGAAFWLRRKPIRRERELDG